MIPLRKTHSGSRLVGKCCLISDPDVILLHYLQQIMPISAGIWILLYFVQLNPVKEVFLANISELNCMKYSRMGYCEQKCGFYCKMCNHSKYSVYKG